VLVLVLVLVLSGNGDDSCSTRKPHLNDMRS